MVGFPFLGRGVPRPCTQVLPRGDTPVVVLEVLSERVKAGMDRDRPQGIHIGRPPVTAWAGFAERWAQVEPEVRAGRPSKSRVARQLGIGVVTVVRLLAPAKGNAAS